MLAVRLAVGLAAGGRGRKRGCRPVRVVSKLGGACLWASQEKLYRIDTAHERRANLFTDEETGGTGC